VGRTSRLKVAIDEDGLAIDINGNPVTYYPREKLRNWIVNNQICVSPIAKYLAGSKLPIGEASSLLAVAIPVIDSTS
jgi:hypothetical protein